MEPQDPQFSLSEAYAAVDAQLSNLTEDELSALSGAIVAEYVNRGNDTNTALRYVIAAAKGGAQGSRIFDRMDT